MLMFLLLANLAFAPLVGLISCINRSNIMPSRCIDCSHRHITFTIPSSLWPFFQKDRSLLDDLFDAASFTLLSWFKGLSKMDSFVPGIICTLHTFGRDLKWHSHIHMLVTESVIGRLTPWKTFDYFPFDMLRKRFISKLIFYLSKKIHSSDLKKIKSYLYKENCKGFYVYKKRCHLAPIIYYLLCFLIWF